MQKLTNKQLYTYIYVYVYTYVHICVLLYTHARLFMRSLSFDVCIVLQPFDLWQYRNTDPINNVLLHP